MKVILVLAVVFSTTKATAPVYASAHHIHADSGRGGNGPNHVNRPFPARLLALCDGIATHGHSSGPQAVGHAIFPVRSEIVCDELAPSASVVGGGAGNSTDDAPEDAPADA